MTNRVFVSFNFADKAVSEKVKLMLAQINQTATVKWVGVTNDVSYNGDTAIAWELEQLMSDCDCALFILGDNPRSSPWLDKEANQAIARELPIVVCRLPEITAIEPDFMKRIKCLEVEYHSDAIASGIETALLEPVGMV